MPNSQEMPSSSIHAWRLPNWKPSTPGSKAESSHSVSAPVAIVASTATSFNSSGRRRGPRITNRAPSRGVRTNAGSTGKEGEAEASTGITNWPS